MTVMNSTDCIGVQEADFDVGEQCAALCAGRDDVGAIATFVGLVRGDQSHQDSAQVSAGKTAICDNTAPEKTAHMTLEHYPGMTEKSLAGIVADARARWPLQGVRVIHRVGCLSVGERIVFVGVASRHREAAFAACAFIMDFLKTQAPFWKKETNASGAGHWVDARTSDDAATQRWLNPAPNPNPKSPV
jgi:molybdopterin synthase catalytic subunit